MLFVALMKAKSGTQEARIARRLAWQMPPIPGIEKVAEYWLETLDPACIVVFKADHIGQIWAAFAGWDDLFEIAKYPAISAEEGLEVLKQMSQP
jgi:Domain of unknown function (DUF3303)